MNKNSTYLRAEDSKDSLDQGLVSLTADISLKAGVAAFLFRSDVNSEITLEKNKQLVIIHALPCNRKTSPFQNDHSLNSRRVQIQTLESGCR